MAMTRSDAIRTAQRWAMTSGQETYIVRRANNLFEPLNLPWDKLSNRRKANMYAIVSPSGEIRRAEGGKES